MPPRLQFPLGPSRASHSRPLRRNTALRACRTLAAAAFLLAALPPAPLRAQSETILQYFNTKWSEIERRIPELAEAGYTSLWLPPPQKSGAGTYSVGYDPLDRFDLGDKDQAGTVPTAYGTKAELLRLVETAHRFGLRIYFDNVMAHNAGDLSDVPAGTLFPFVPGFVPEDFHIVRNEGGGWRKASNSVDYTDEWQVLNRNPFAYDIAQEDPNTSFDPNGQQENLDYPKWHGIRHPGQTSLYPDNDLPGVTDAHGIVFHPFADKEPWQDIGYGPSNTGAGNGKFDWDDANSNGQHDAGEASEPFTDTGIDPTNPARQTAAWGYGDSRYNMGDPVSEDVNSMLIRSLRWTVDQTRCDGFRLDAVKHVPSYFFGQQSGDKDPSSAGYLGSAQAQHNLTRGYTDWSNHRDSSFSTNVVRNDLLVFGEHLGAPPNPNDYLSSGMRVANDDFLNNIGGFGGIGSSLSGYDTPGLQTFGVNGGMMYCLSHDNNYMSGSERPAAHQYMLTRAGIPIVYTDGFNISGGPSYFPKPSYAPFLGQYGQTYITGSLPLRRDFIRGDQWPRWSSQDVAGWEFRDYSENPSMSDADAATLVVMHARNYTSGQQMPFSTVFAAGSRLKNYSPYGGGFYATVGNDGLLRGDSGNVVIIPSGGYFAFSYDTPGLPTVWQGSARSSIEIQENGVTVPTIGVARKDGRDGDPAYAYTAQIPVIRNGANLRFVARADGSATNILMRLDGGIDLNSQMNPAGQTTYPVGRDHPPGSSKDTFLGYEQMRFVHRVTEKFAAQVTNTGRDIIGSPGAETWECTIGSAGFTVNAGNGPQSDTDTADWAYHLPTNADIDGTAQAQFSPAPASASGQPITVWVKIGYKDQATKAWLYYTADGASYPEGSAGAGRDTTQVVALAYDRDAPADGGGTSEWWRGTIPALSAGTKLRYKIGVHKTNVASQFPGNADLISQKQKMETVFEVANFNAATCTVFPHNDLTERRTGLAEGFHVLETRAYLKRDNRASLFKTNVQTFYYDLTPPSGNVAFPAQNSTVSGTYGIAVTTDSTTSTVQYRIRDTSAANDSASSGNGASNWADAVEVTPTVLGSTGDAREWRFDYSNIPTSGNAIVEIRLKEASSSADNTLSDSEGWFTTLTRNLSTGTPVNFRIQYPDTDGAVVSPSYTAKVYFDKSLSYDSGNPIPSEQMLGEFVVKLDGKTLPSSALTFVRDETGSESALAFDFPVFYSGNPDDLHTLTVTHTRGDIAMASTRLVKSAPGPILDTDGDGMSDWWEELHGFNHLVADGADDRDFDGISNVLEFLAGTDPSALTPPITPRIVRIGGVTQLRFPVIPNRHYQVEFSTDLVTWMPASTSFTVPTADTDYLWTEPTAIGTPRLYRVAIVVP